MKNWRLQTFTLMLLFSCTSSRRKSRRERSGRISFAAFELLLFKNTNLRGKSGCSCAAAQRKVAKSSLKLLQGSRWDVRKCHGVGSDRKPCSVPAQQSSAWGLSCATGSVQQLGSSCCSKGIRGRSSDKQGFLIDLINRKISTLNAFLSCWPFS